MKISKVTPIYFSATGTTRKVVESIAEGIKVEDVEPVDLTLPKDVEAFARNFSNELVILGAPVYGGRLPAQAVDRFKQLRGNKTLAVLVVVYGNREFEDALVELKNLSMELGFIPVAGGAFIGEHSFASEEVPIANGRPNSEDLQIAREFGERISEKIAALESTDTLKELKVPGRFPYVAGGARPLQASPVTNEDLCTVCGTCASVCPTGAITVDERVTTVTEQCIRCCACIKSCPEDARQFEDKMMKDIANWLSQYFKYPKEPRLVGVDM